MTTKKILGVRFFSGNALAAVSAGVQGGLVVVPSAPVLVGIAESPALRESLLGADLAITDSGLMVLMWWLLKQEKMERVSGLEYLKLLLQMLKPESGDLKPESLETPVVPQVPGLKFQVSSSPSGLRSQVSGLAPSPQLSGLKSQVSLDTVGGVFWVMPTEAARDRNLAWLRAQGFATTADDCYVAPKYPVTGPLADEQLLTIIQQRKPAHIIIALGGGVQERLGWFLKQELEKAGSPATPLFSTENPGYVLKPASASAVPGIHCIGAAIGFLSGEQVRIPMWVDYLYLGWLWRSVSSPRRFVPRYLKAARLVPLMIRYGANAPVAKET